MTPDTEAVLPRSWKATLRYAVRNRKGVVKTSTVTRHTANMTSQEARRMLGHMVAAGYLTEPEKVGQIYVWHVTEKGREVVE